MLQTPQVAKLQLVEPFLQTILDSYFQTLY